MNTMKKASYSIIPFCMLLICLFLVFPTFACANDTSLPDCHGNQPNKAQIVSFSTNRKSKTEEETVTAFHLPESLVFIDEEAFEETAVSVITLPESLIGIGDYAFANIKSLKTIYIPSNTIQIGQHAFTGSNQVTITSAPNSYAREWAKANGIPFSPIMCFCALNYSNSITEMLSESTETQKVLSIDEANEKKQAESTGRTARETNASKYDGCTAFHIQGRSPPTA